MGGLPMMRAHSLDHGEMNNLGPALTSFDDMEIPIGLSGPTSTSRGMQNLNPLQTGLGKNSPNMHAGMESNHMGGFGPMGWRPPFSSAPTTTSTTSTTTTQQQQAQLHCRAAVAAAAAAMNNSSYPSAGPDGSYNLLNRIGVGNLPMGNLPMLQKLLPPRVPGSSPMGSMSAPSGSGLELLKGMSGHYGSNDLSANLRDLDDLSMLEELQNQLLAQTASAGQGSLTQAGQASPSPYSQEGE